MNCPECHGALVAPDGLTGELICESCGLVIGQPKASHGFTAWTPDWRSNWNQSDSETLREWLTMLRTVSNQLKLQDFIYREEAARLVRQNKNILRLKTFGENKRETTAALYYLVLRRYNEIRSLKDICNELSLNHVLVKKCAWNLQKMAGTRRAFSSEDYLRKYGWKLVSDPKLIETTGRLLEDIHGEIGGNPVSLAAGAFYSVCKSRKIKVSTEDVGRAFCISSRTVYSNERRIRKLMETRVPNLNSMQSVNLVKQQI